MFVQIIEGPVGDRQRPRQLLERWRGDLAGGASGWLGTTAGVTDDGTFLAVVRFASREEAQANSDRPEQGAWWREFEQVFTAPPTFHDCERAELVMDGGSDDAGFVQVIRGRSSDPDRLLERWRALEGALRDFRPDVIGGIAADHGDGTWSQVMYFTSEEEARENEGKEPPPELQEEMRELDALFGDLRYYDLRDPYLASP